MAAETDEKEKTGPPARPHGGAAGQESGEFAVSGGAKPGLKKLFPFPPPQKGVPAAPEPRPSAPAGASPFIDHLLRKGLITREALDQALGIKKKNGDTDKRRLHHILIEELGADREMVFGEFARFYSFRVIDLATVEMNAERLAFMNKTMGGLPPKIRELAVANKVIPFQVAEGEPNKIQLITPDPTNPEIPTISRGFDYPRHEICYISLHSFEELSRELTLDRQNRPAISDVEFVEDESMIDELDEEIRRGHLQELIDSIFSDSVRVGASDIHFVPRAARRTEVSFRMDGHLNLWQTIEDVRADAVSAVVKDFAKGTDRFERNAAQDGFVQITHDNKIVRFRVSIIPVVGKDLKVKFESIVIRVLTDPEASITIDNIGFQAEELKRFKAAIDKPYGIVILTGPTGSGKSTTLLAALRAVMSPSYNILTVEDPVEYWIEGARQVKLNPRLDFEGALRAILRHDPDIVMVGEIRDRMTADIAVKLANTGHLTFSTLHTNDAPSVIARLYKMGVEPFLLAYSINIIVAQRLVRKLCDRCKVPDHEILPASLKRIGFPEEHIASTTFYHPAGCIHCVKGYKGRRAIHEVLEFTKEIRQLIMEAGSSINEEAIRQTAIRQGMTTLRQSGIEMLKKGTTTIEEITTSTSE